VHPKRKRYTHHAGRRANSSPGRSRKGSLRKASISGVSSWLFPNSTSAAMASMRVAIAASYATPSVKKSSCDATGDRASQTEAGLRMLVRARERRSETVCVLLSLPCVCVCVCVRSYACARARVRACVRACVLFCLRPWPWCVC